VSNLRWGFILGITALIISFALGLVSGVSLFYVFVRSIVFFFVFFGLGAGIRVVISTYFPELLFLDDETESPITFDQPETGSQVDITLGSSGDYAIPELYRNNDDQELGNIEDLISGVFKPRSSGSLFETPKTAFNDRPESRSEFQSINNSDEPGDIKWTSPLPTIDRNEEDDYNDRKGGGAPEDFQFEEFQGSPEVFETAAPYKPVFTPSFGDDSGGLGGLPDLDAMAMAFSPNFSGEQAQAQPQSQHPNSFEEQEPVVYNKGNKAQPMKGDFNPKELAQGIRTVLSKEK